MTSAAADSNLDGLLYSNDRIFFNVPEMLHADSLRQSSSWSSWSSATPTCWDTFAKLKSSEKSCGKINAVKLLSYERQDCSSSEDSEAPLSTLAVIQNLRLVNMLDFFSLQHWLLNPDIRGRGLLLSPAEALLQTTEAILLPAKASKDMQIPCCKSRTSKTVEGAPP